MLHDANARGLMGRREGAKATHLSRRYRGLASNILHATCGGRPFADYCSRAIRQLAWIVALNQICKIFLISNFAPRRQPPQVVSACPPAHRAGCHSSRRLLKSGCENRSGAIGRGRPPSIMATLRAESPVTCCRRRPA